MTLTLLDVSRVHRPPITIVYSRRAPGDIPISVFDRHSQQLAASPDQTSPVVDPPTKPQVRRSSRIFTQPIRFVESHLFTPRHRAFLAAVHSFHEPQSTREAGSRYSMLATGNV